MRTANKPARKSVMLAQNLIIKFDDSYSMLFTPCLASTLTLTGKFGKKYSRKFRKIRI